MAHLKFLVAVLALAGCGAAMADPVSLVSIAAGVAAQAGLISATAAFYVSLGAAVLGMAMNRRKQKRMEAAQRAQYNASLTDRTVTVLNTESPWRIVYGSPAPFAGSVVAIFTSGARDQFKHVVYVFAAHECEAIDELYIDGEPIGSLDVNGWATAGAFVEVSTETTTIQVALDGSGQGTYPLPITQVVSFADAILAPQVSFSYDSGTGLTTFTAPAYANSTVSAVVRYTATNSRVNVQKHLSPGGVDTADPVLISYVPSQWTAAHKLSGFTYVVLTVDLNMPRFQGGPPNLTAKVRGKKLYDPRTGTTAYSANPILARMDFIMSEYGFGADLDQFDEDLLIAAANACDFSAYSASAQTAGTAVLYSCDGVFTTDQDRETTLQQLEDCCAGTTHESGGVWRLMAGYWAAPVMTLGDDDAQGPVDVIQASNSSRERFNGARGTYCDWRNLGVSTEFQPYSNSTYLAADAEAQSLDLALPFTNAHQRAIQLARVAVERSRGGFTLGWPGSARTYALQPGDRVVANYSEFGISGQTFMVAGWGMDLTKPFGLELVEDVATFYDLADDASVDPAPNTGLSDPFSRPAAPTNFRASSGTDQLQVQADGTVLTRVLLQWDAADALISTSGEVQITWSEVGSSVTQSIVLGGSATETYLTGVADGTALVLTARFVRFVGNIRVVGGAAAIPHVVIGKTEPPSVPTGVSLTQDLVFFRTGGEADLAGVRIRALPGNVSNPSFSRGSDVITGLVLTSPARMERRLFGLQTVMVVSEDTSGNQSSPASAVLDFGDPNTDDAVFVREYALESFPGTYTTCALSGGAVVASVDPSANLYSLADLYGEPNVYATLYQAMTWQAGLLLVPHNGTLVVEGIDTIEGAAVTVEYRISGDTVADLYPSSDVYASSDLYGAASEWSLWPGALSVTAGTPVDLRVTVASGSVQGRITSFAPSLVMETVEQEFSVSIDAAGTRLTPSAGTPPRVWVENIGAVYGLPAVDGNGAVAARVLDYSPVLGPLLQLVNSTGTAVAGRGIFTVKGNSDV